MKDKIVAYNSELNNIQLVLDKLVTKQNSSVFDKLCNMCNDLFGRICDYNASELTLEDIHGLIDLLKRLLKMCQTLKDYKGYLIDSINSNIETMQQQANEVAAPPAVETVTQEDIGPVEVVEAVDEVPLENNVAKLQLNPNEEKNAA